MDVMSPWRCCCGDVRAAGGWVRLHDPAKSTTTTTTAATTACRRGGSASSTAALLLALYLVVMDVVLMFRLQNLPIDPSPSSSSSSSSSSPLNDTAHRVPPLWSDLLLPDTAIKGVFMDPMNQHIFMPLARITEVGLNLHESAPWLSPDRISASHVLVAVVGMRFVACRESLGARRVGVLLFALRFYLDALDGVVARAARNASMADPGIGSHGHLVDGVCDLAGTVCQLLATLVLLRAHKECASLAAALTLAAQWAALIAVSSLGWNTAIGRFHDILEPPATPDPMARQLVMMSVLLWLVAWLWRLLNPHALTASLLVAVFFDRHWEWCNYALRRLAVVLGVLIVLTEVELRIATITLDIS